MAKTKALEEREPPSPVAARLREARNSAGLTLDDVVQRTGMSSSGVWKVENRSRFPSGDVLARLCQVYGVSADWILFGDAESVEPEHSGWNEWLDQAPESMTPWERMVLASIRFGGWTPPWALYSSILSALRTHRDMAEKASSLAKSAIGGR